MGKIKVGILLLYLELYDEVMPELRSKFRSMTEGIKDTFIENAISVEISDICCVASDFEDAIRSFEKKSVDVLVSLHLSYSPSMEVTSALIETDLPLVVFDTTIKDCLLEDPKTEDVMQNHGIHGVQDMCNMLLRNKKRFLITAGHWRDEKTINRLVCMVKSSFLKRRLSTTRAASIGGFFEGMGDFYVPKKKIFKDFGIEVVDADPREIVRLMPGPGQEVIAEETEKDKDLFNTEGLDKDSYIDTLRISLALRKWIEENEIDAFSMNFSSLTEDSGFPTLPFLEAGKLMARGIGYAGEGDILTASLVSALLDFEKDTSFVEMFCPDWKNDLIYLSHMGEMNIRLSKDRPRLTKRSLAFTTLGDPVMAVGRFKPGKALLADLAPSEKGYSLILCPVEVMDIKEELGQVVSGWIRPEVFVKDFLEEYSMHGGTHHLAMVYGKHIKELEGFGHIMGFDTIVIT